MKKLLYTFMSLAVLSTACDPNEELYAELDANAQTAPEGHIVITLTDEDYGRAIPGEDDDEIGNDKRFGSLEEVRQYVPNILDYNYPHLGNKSSAFVTFNLYRGFAPEINAYTGAQSYALGEADYAGASEEAGNAGFFNNDVVAADYLPGILANQIDAPEDGQLTAVSYKYANKAYADIEGVVLFEEGFETAAAVDAYTSQSVSGAQEWTWSDAGGQTYAKMSGYAGGNQANEDWLVLSPIDLSNYADAVLKLSQAINYIGAGVAGEDLAIMVSTDYAGDVTTATWDNLELDQWPAGNNWTFVDSEVSLAAYEGETIHIAFYYNSTTTYAPTWEVSTAIVEVGETVPTALINLFYSYDAAAGAWAPVQDNVTYLASTDYDAMGAPGQYDNFSSSVSPDNYLPAFLRNKYPYAQEEDEQIIVYKYYSGGIQTRGDLYTFLDGNWEKYQSQTAETLQFGKENGIWVPDNTIKYTLTVDDFDFIGANFSEAAGDIDNYNNINMGKYSEEQVIAYLGAVLKNNFPEAAVGQKYRVTFATYNPRGTAERHLILNEEGTYVPVQ